MNEYQKVLKLVFSYITFHNTVTINSKFHNFHKDLRQVKNIILTECDKVKGLIDEDFQVVPGGGFEPPTRGFSVLCSTPELPGPLDSKTILGMYFLR